MRALCEGVRVWTRHCCVPSAPWTGPPSAPREGRRQGLYTCSELDGLLQQSSVRMTACVCVEGRTATASTLYDKSRDCKLRKACPSAHSALLPCCPAALPPQRFNNSFECPQSRSLSRPRVRSRAAPQPPSLLVNSPILVSASGV